MTAPDPAVAPGAGPTAEDPPGLRMSALREHLGGRLPGFAPDQPVEADLLAGGRSNVTYRLTQGGRSWVLRRPPLGHVLPTAHDMAREFRVLSGLARADVPVPRVLLLCTDPAVLGVTFQVMEYVAGRTLADAADSAGMPPAEARAVGEAAVDALLQLHAVDAVATGLGDLGRPQGYLVRQVARWRTQWEGSRTRPVDGLDRLADWIAERAPAYTDRPWSVVHGDYRIDNLILDPHRPAVRAIVDWEMSTLGDPIGDLALLLVYWTSTSDRLRGRVPVALGITDGPGFPDRRAVLERYAAVRPVEEDHLRLCLALCCFKLAVVMESIAYRAAGGAYLGRDVSGMAGAAPALIALGLAAAEGGVDALTA